MGLLLKLLLMAKAKRRAVLKPTIARSIKVLYQRRSAHKVYRQIICQRNRVAALRKQVKTRHHMRKQRSFGVRMIFQDHETHGAWFTLIPKLREHDPEKHYNFFRMRVEEFDKLLNLIQEPLVKKSIRKPICPGERLAVTLRFYATGDSFLSLSYLFRVSDQVISNIVQETSVVIWTTLEPLVFERPSEAMWLRVAAEYESMWQFPHCVGAIDGKHVYIKAPPLSGSRYFSYKERYSFILMAVADAKRKIILLDVGASGRRGDGNVFHASQFGKKLERGNLHLPVPCQVDGIEEPLPFVFLGDGAFEKSQNLLNPFKPGKGQKFLSPPTCLFNGRFSRARHCVEDVFGLLFKRYGLYARPIETSKTTARYAVLATCCLHNYHLMEEESVPPKRIRPYPELYFDFEKEDGTVVRGRYRNEDPKEEKLAVERLHKNVTSAKSSQMKCHLVGEEIRELLLDYFIDHPITWQWKKYNVL